MAHIGVDPNDEEKQQQLDQDYDPPFSQPDDVTNTAPSTHPASDTNVQVEEEYDEGETNAAGINDLHEDSAENEPIEPVA